MDITTDSTRHIQPDYMLSAFYAEPARRMLWLRLHVDAELAGLIPKIKEPMMGMVRLAWWEEQLCTAQQDGIVGNTHPLVAHWQNMHQSMHQSMPDSIIPAHHIHNWVRWRSVLLDPDPAQALQFVVADNASLVALADAASICWYGVLEDHWRRYYGLLRLIAVDLTTSPYLLAHTDTLYTVLQKLREQAISQPTTRHVRCLCRLLHTAIEKQQAPITPPPWWIWRLYLGV